MALHDRKALGIQYIKIMNQAHHKNAFAVAHKIWVGVTKQISSVPLVTHFFHNHEITRYLKFYRCQIIIWFNEFDIYFCKTDNFPNGWNSEWNFSNPPLINHFVHCQINGTNTGLLLNRNYNTTLFIGENWSENVVCKMTASFSGPQRVNNSGEELQLYLYSLPSHFRVHLLRIVWPEVGSEPELSLMLATK